MDCIFNIYYTIKLDPSVEFVTPYEKERIHFE